MIRSLPRRAFHAYIAAFTWLGITIADNVGDPFGIRIRRFHGGISRLVNRHAGDWMYFEYDAWRHTYVIGANHPKAGPDEYELGHTAGKLAAVLGALPLIVALAAIEILAFVVPHLPGHPAVGLATMVVVFCISLFAVSAGYHWLFLSVEMQDLDREVSGS